MSNNQQQPHQKNEQPGHDYERQEREKARMAQEHQEKKNMQGDPKSGR